MDAMIKDINSNLQEIIDSLTEMKDTDESVLTEVETKINEKKEEAKLYKEEIETNKQFVKDIEAKIEVLESDLAELKDRFSKKEFANVVETGKREINAQIAEKRSQINKHNKKIKELTEKGRSTKELLASLKKDKVTKEKKLEEITLISNFYNNAVGRIISYADENPNSLEAFNAIYETEEEAPISTIIYDDVETNDYDNEEPIYTGFEVEEEETDQTDFYSNFEVPEPEPTPELNLDIPYEPASFESPSTFSTEEPLLTEESIPTQEPMFENNDALDVFNNPPPPVEPIIEITDEAPMVVDEPVVEEVNNSDLISFLQENGIDVNNISPDVVANTIVTDYDNAKKVLGVLKDNDIDINAVLPVLNANPENLNAIIAKLLLSDQTKNNIALVLSALPILDITNLDSTIQSYGPNIKDVNITDMILKAVTNPPETNIEYIKDLGFNDEEKNNMINNLPPTTIQSLTLFPKIASTNYQTLNKFNVNNIKEVFSGYPHMFLLNPERFDAILEKYNPEDLVRCIEKNAAVIEKL